MKLIPDKFSLVRFISEGGILIALAIVLTRFFSITMIDMRFSFSFIVYIVAGMRWGPLPTGLISFLTDLLGAYLFPVGPPHYGLMLVAFLSGLAYGLFLYGEWSWTKIIVFILVQQFLIHGLLNSYYLTDFTGNPFLVQVMRRLPHQLVNAGLKLVAVLAIWRSPLYDRIRRL